MSFSIHFSPETVRLGRAINQRLSSLNTTFRRISSGVRVSQASDNAATLKINSQLEAQLRATQKEIEGTTQKTSMLQTLEDALAQSEERILKMRTLALEAANGSRSFMDRQALNLELNSIMEELNAISDEAVFNGIKLLDADEPLMLSLNHDEPSKQLLKVNSVRPDQLARQSSASSQRRGIFLAPIESGDVSLNGVNIRATNPYDDPLSYSHQRGSAIAKAAAINDSTPFTGIRAWAEENVVRAIAPLAELDFTQEHWLKINGFGISGFQLEAGDANRELTRQINAGISQTGVEASVDNEGYLALRAADGRNITIEYSDATVRRAIQVVDIYGDPVNVDHSIEQPVYTSNGDIVSISYEGSGSYDGQVDVQSSYMLGEQVIQDQSGQHLEQTDLADYYIEVIKPGTVGEATYRIKKENLIPGVIDTSPEGDPFTVPGTLSSSNTSRVSIASNAHYDSASDRRYRLVVVEAGDPNPNTVGSRPLIEVFESNLSDESSVETSLGTFRVNTSNQLDLGNGVLLDIHSENLTRYAEGPSGTQTFFGQGTTPRAELVNDPEGHDYGKNIALSIWSGAHTTEFEFEVIQGGHAYLNRAPGNVDEPRAIIRATAYEPSTGKITQVNRYAGDAYANINGLRFYAPWQHSYYDSRGYSLQEDNYIIRKFQAPSYTFTNENPRQYLLTATEDTVITPYSPAEFRLDIFDIDPTTGLKTLIQSTNEEMYSRQYLALGPNEVNGTIDYSEYDGVILGVYHSSVYLASQSEIQGSTSNVSFANESFETPGGYTGVLEITQAGEAGGEARFKYYAKHDPSTIIDSGVLHENALLADGVRYNASSFDTQSTLNGITTYGFNASIDHSQYQAEQKGDFTLEISHDNSQTATLSQSQGPASHFSLVSDAYDGYFDGTYNISVRSNEATLATDDYLLDVDFVINGVAEPTQTFAFAEDTNIDIGHGLSVHFASPVTGDGMTAVNEQMAFDGSLTATDYMGLVSWSYADGTSSGPSLVDLNVNQEVDLGNQLKFQVNGLKSGMKYTGSVDPRGFNIGDRWEARMEAWYFREGDSLYYNYEPVDLEVGARWAVTAYNPSEWLVGDEIVIDATNNYGGDIQTLEQNLSYGEVMGTLEFNGSGSFNTGDLIKVKTRAFMGEVESGPGYYLMPAYPTTYHFAVTKGGTLDEAEISWVRADQRTDSENGGSGLLGQGTPLVADEYMYVEEGIKIMIKDVLNQQGDSVLYLAQGDTFSMNTGDQLEHSFAGQLTLKSADNIEIKYNSGANDNALGRMTFQGGIEEANNIRSDVESPEEALFGKNLQQSLATTNLLSPTAIRDTLHSLDVSLAQISENRATVGAAMNQVERQSLTLAQKSLDLLGIQSRLNSADIAQEVAQQAAKQIQVRLAPTLLRTSKTNALMILNLVNKQSAF